MKTKKKAYLHWDSSVSQPKGKFLPVEDRLGTVQWALPSLCQEHHQGHGHVQLIWEIVHVEIANSSVGKLCNDTILMLAMENDAIVNVLTLVWYLLVLSIICANAW